jgi:hypothetical protein
VIGNRLEDAELIVLRSVLDCEMVKTWLQGQEGPLLLSTLRDSVVEEGRLRVRQEEVRDWRDLGGIYRAMYDEWSRLDA